MLLNIFSFPAAFTSDAICVAAMSETIADDERTLEAEYDWVKENYPDVNIESEMVTGEFLDELEEKTNNEDIALIVMGAGGHYDDLLSWDTNIIDTFIDLRTPVLVIPSNVKYQPIRKVAFACNYYRNDLEAPVSLIRRLIQFTKADLFLIHVVNPSAVVDEDALKNKELLDQSLADLNPVFYEPAFTNVITAIDTFTAEQNIDMLIVIPGRHGIWDKIFRQQHAKGLVHLNRVPVMSLYSDAALF